MAATTPILISGFEEGLVGSGGQIWGDHTQQGSATIQVSSAAARHGTYGLRGSTIDSAGSRCGIGMLTSGATGFLAACFDFRVNTLPGANLIKLFEAGGAGGYSALQLASDGQLSHYVHSSGGTQNGPVITTGVWYTAKISIDTRANPWVARLSIDDVEATQATYATAANATRNHEWYLEVWQSDALTPGGCQVDFDNLMISTTPADALALGRTKIIGYVLNGAGTHATPTSFETTTNSFTGNTGLESDANAHQKIDEIPWSTASTDYLRQSVSGTGHHAEFQVADSAEATGAPVTAVSVKAFCRTASAANAALSGRIALSGNETTLFSTTTLNSTGRVTLQGVAAAKPGGGAWTAGDFNSTLVRLGFSGDVSPNPWVDAVLVEVAYPIVVGGAATQTLPSLATAGSGAVTAATAVTGTAAQTLPSLAQGGAGAARVDGTAGSSLPAVAQAAAGGARASGAAAATLPSATQGAAGAALVSGEGSSTLPSVASAAEAAAKASATAASVLAPLGTAAAAGATVRGGATNALPGATTASSGAVRVVGPAAQDLPSLASSGAGVTGATSGSAASQLPPLETQASGAARVEGSAASQLPAAASAGVGMVGDEEVPATGSAASQLPALAQEAFAHLKASGQAAGSMPSLATSGSGVLIVSGGAAGTLGPVASQASASLSAQGAATSAMPSVASAADAEATVGGPVQIALPGLDAAGTGLVPSDGAVIVTLPTLAQSATGRVELTVQRLQLSGLDPERLEATSGVDRLDPYAGVVRLEEVS